MSHLATVAASSGLEITSPCSPDRPSLSVGVTYTGKDYERRKVVALSGRLVSYVRIVSVYGAVGRGGRVFTASRGIFTKYFAAFVAPGSAPEPTGEGA